MSWCAIKIGYHCFPGVFLKSIGIVPEREVWLQARQQSADAVLRFRYAEPAATLPLRRLAEREGFEPPIRLPVCRISSAVHSTTLPPLHTP